MRADRLLSLLLLLQQRGRMPAGALAAELEVSERTIYRDIEALGSAGVPVYGERGPQGGYSLLDGYRTSLTGLTAGEMRAFFMLSIPAPLADLGLTQNLKTALLKLSAALPAAQRAEEEGIRQRFHIDATGWRQGGAPAPHLQTIFQAVQQDRRLDISYRLPQGIEMQQTVDPYGLVAKAGVWYLVCASNGRRRAQRVAQLYGVRMREESFLRPPDFNLAAFWQDWCADYEGGRWRYTVVARLAPELAAQPARFFGDYMSHSELEGQPDAEGRITLELAFESLFEARSRLLGWGRAVEVLEPEALRLSIADFAAQIVDLYGQAQSLA